MWRMSSLVKKGSAFLLAVVVVVVVVAAAGESPTLATTGIVHPSDDENLTCRCVEETLTCRLEDEKLKWWCVEDRHIEIWTGALVTLMVETSVTGVETNWIWWTRTKAIRTWIVSEICIHATLITLQWVTTEETLGKLEPHHVKFLGNIILIDFDWQRRSRAETKRNEHGQRGRNRCHIENWPFKAICRTNRKSYSRPRFGRRRPLPSRRNSNPTGAWWFVISGNALRHRLVSPQSRARYCTLVLFPSVIKKLLTMLIVHLITWIVLVHYPFKCS